MIELSLGWWLVPACITLFCFYKALLLSTKETGAYGIGVLIDTALYVAAAAVSLMVWLVWALVY